MSWTHPEKKAVSHRISDALVTKLPSSSRMAEFYGKYPCHRVVNHVGRTAPGWRAQKMLLEDEGVEFKANGCVDMKQYQWEE